MSLRIGQLYKGCKVCKINDGIYFMKKVDPDKVSGCKGSCRRCINEIKEQSCCVPKLPTGNIENPIIADCNMIRQFEDLPKSKEKHPNMSHDKTLKKLLLDIV